MTAQIEYLEAFQLEFYELLDIDHFAVSGDAHAIDSEGNVLGAGELWQRLGSAQGPVVPTESVAIGYGTSTLSQGVIFSGVTFSPKNNPSVIPWKVAS